MQPIVTFPELGLAEPILRALAAAEYSVATPIQATAIPLVMEGRDVLGCAQTGTGKTAAFALPFLHRLSAIKPADRGGKPRCLVLSPTRELATQIADSFKTYGRHVALRCGVIFGGVNQGPQAAMLRKGLDVIVATPGRLLDLLNQRLVDLSSVNVLVLDEADRMLDMGFIHDVKRIVSRVGTERQTLLFSATLPSEVRALAASMLRNPIQAHVPAVSATADNIEQCVYHVEKRNKPALLAHLIVNRPMSRAIVFARTKHGADKVVRHLHQSGIRAEAIHGNKSQNARQRALGAFREDKIGVLVATDIASRGIDIDGVTHVVNYDLTHEPETYVHRIGRTARAGAKGEAISFCDREEMPNLKAIERLLRKTIPVSADQPQYSAQAPRSQQHSHDGPSVDEDRRREPRHASPTHQPAADRHVVDRHAAPGQSDERREVGGGVNNGVKKKFKAAFHEERRSAPATAYATAKPFAPRRDDARHSPSGAKFGPRPHGDRRSAPSGKFSPRPHDDRRAPRTGDAGSGGSRSGEARSAHASASRAGASAGAAPGGFGRHGGSKGAVAHAPQARRPFKWGAKGR